MRIAILSTSNHAGADLLAEVAARAELLLPEQVAAWQPIDPTIVLPSSVTVLSRVAELRDDDWAFVGVPALGPVEAAAGDLAYHWEEQGIPFGLVLADARQDRESVLDGYLHEIGETVNDPFCSAYLRGWSREIHDMVQGLVLTRGGRALPAWGTPGWFGEAKGRCVVYDGDLDLEPGALSPEGYMRREDGTQIPPAYRPRRGRDHEHSRAARRERRRLVEMLKG